MTLGNKALAAACVSEIIGFDYDLDSLLRSETH